MKFMKLIYVVDTKGLKAISTASDKKALSKRNRKIRFHARDRRKCSSSPRSISIGQLYTLPCLHIRPIKLVVYK